jgi:hypothetical protein
MAPPGVVIARYSVTEVATAVNSPDRTRDRGRAICSRVASLIPDRRHGERRLWVDSSRSGRLGTGTKKIFEDDRVLSAISRDE